MTFQWLIPPTHDSRLMCRYRQDGSGRELHVRLAVGDSAANRDGNIGWSSPRVERRCSRSELNFKFEGAGSNEPAPVIADLESVCVRLGASASEEDSEGTDSEDGHAAWLGSGSDLRLTFAAGHTLKVDGGAAVLCASSKVFGLLSENRAAHARYAELIAVNSFPDGKLKSGGVVGSGGTGNVCIQDITSKPIDIVG